MDVFQASLQDSDLATAETIKTMCGHVHRAAGDPLVQRAAHQAEQSWGVERPSSLVAAGLGLVTVVPGASAFWWVKHLVKQVPHDQFKRRVAAFPQKRQLLISPEVVVRAQRPAGDCTTFSMLIAAMLEALGMRWELVTVAVDPEDPTNYSHVFVRAVLDDGARLTLDGSHGKHPGWEVPRAHQFRRQVWDSDGEPITDQAPPISTLGAYMPRPRWGLGDDSVDVGDESASALPTASLPTTPASGSLYYDASGVAAQDATGTTDLSSLFASEGLYTASVPSLTTLGASQTGYVAPSQSSTNWAAFATALAKSGMTLAEINAIQPGTVVSANGAILRQATGLPVPVGTGITAALGSTSTTMWLVLAAVVGGAFLLMGNKR
jgi:hypothetical protein